MDKPRASERRTFLRYPCNFLVSALDPEADKGIEAQAQDISAQGIGLRSSYPLGKGEDLELWIHLPGDASPIHTYGKVIWSQKMEQGFRLGIKFDSLHLLPLGVALEKASN